MATVTTPTPQKPDVPPPRRLGSLVARVVGALLVATAAFLAFSSLVMAGVYPPGLSGPYAVVLAAYAVALLITGVLALGFPRWVCTRSSPSMVAIAGPIAGLASVIAFVLLVGRNLSLWQDMTIPAAGRWVPVVMGAIAMVVGMIGLLSARGDGPSRRMSLAGGVLGLATAATTVWLSSASCWLFVDRWTCSMP